MKQGTKDEQGYQGWTNYETWVTKRWLDYEQWSCDHLRELTKEAREQAPKSSQVKEKRWTVDVAGGYLLADMVRDLVEQLMDNDAIAGEASLKTDLLGEAIENINFDEIAENLLREVKTTENMCEFKGKATFEWEFESDLDVSDLIDYAIDNIRDALECLGEFKEIKVTIKKRRRK